MGKIDRVKYKAGIEAAKFDFEKSKALAETGLNACNSILDLLRRERPDDEIRAVVHHAKLLRQ